MINDRGKEHGTQDAEVRRQRRRDWRLVIGDWEEEVRGRRSEVSGAEENDQ